MVFSLDQWCGKVAIVTGTSVGIGASIAERLVEEGLKVVGLARRVDKVEELSKKLNGKKGKLYAVKADISKEEDILTAFKWVADNLGPVHILINNAGVVKQTNLTEGDTELWRQVFDTNVLGICIATREAVKVMRANNIDGHIIHINSVLGHQVLNVPGVNVYPASKFAVTALTETLRQELNQIGSKIKITSISPGVVRTEFAKTNNFIMTPEMAEKINTGPALESEDITEAVVYVLSTPSHVQIHELTLRPVGDPF